MATRSKKKTRRYALLKSASGWGALAGYSVVVWVVIYILAYLHLENGYKRELQLSRQYAQRLAFCQKFGARCELHACYRTDDGKFICTGH